MYLLIISTHKKSCSCATENRVIEKKKHLSIDSIISPRLYRSIDDDDDDDYDDARNKITTPTTLLSRPVRTCGRFHK